jgi:hypothetical protein
MYWAICEVCASSNCGGFSSACASWRAIGMRPVPTWNSTAAEPTPIRLGPRPWTPWALTPWQVMQLLSKSALPSCAVEDSVRSSSA